MSGMVSVFVANGISVVLMLAVSLSLRQSKRYGTVDDKLFVSMIIAVAFLSILETASFMADYMTVPNRIFINRILNAALYAFDSIPIIIWVLFVEYKVNGDISHLKKKALVFSIPSAVIIILSVLSVFFDLFFTVDADNVYHRLTLSVIPYIFTYIYFVYATAFVYSKRKKIHRYLFMPMLAFMLPPLVGSILQFMFYGLSLTWVSVAISVVIMYMNVQTEASSIDGLTGLYNRIYMENYLKTEIRRDHGGKIFAGIMMDVDKFKSINDTFGHGTGDRALENVGRIIHRSTHGDDFAARYAGDEFVVFTHAKSERDVIALIERMEDNVEGFNISSGAPYRLSLSYGYTILEKEKNDSFDDFLRMMDQEMYKMKNSGKR